MRLGQDPNDYSLCLLCGMDDVSLLLTGDLSGSYERYAAVSAHLLKVAHHGSKNSTTDAFLDAVGPETALISASASSGASDKDGTLQTRLRQRGIKVFTTAGGGAVRIDISGSSYRVTTLIHEQGADDGEEGTDL